MSVNRIKVVRYGTGIKAALLCLDLRHRSHLTKRCPPMFPVVKGARK